MLKPINILRFLLGMAGVLLFWQALVWIYDLPHFILPSPFKVAQTLVFSREILIENAWITIAEVLFGLLIGTLLGALTAILIAFSKTLRTMFEPFMVITQAIPVFALAPILTLWLGYGMASKIFMAVLITYFPVASNFFDGLVRCNRDWIDLARTMGARPFSIMVRVQVPAALPSLMSGVKLATVYAPIGAVIGEWVGASKGLGYLMLLANGRAKIDLMFAALFVLALFTVCLYLVVSNIANKVSAKASGQQEREQLS